MKNIEELVKHYQETFLVLDVVSLSGWTPDKWTSAWTEFKNHLVSLRKEKFDNNERLLFIFNTNDYDTLTFEIFFKKFIKILNKVDVSNFFTVILINDDIKIVEKYFKQYSADHVLPQIHRYNNDNSQASVDKPRDTFCVAPWVHLMATPYHGIKTCCMGTEELDYLNKTTFNSAWNNDSIQEIRKALLNDSYHTNCEKCYEQEKHNKLSTRNMLNQSFKHKINEIKEKKEIVLTDFKLLYLDMRFTNLCNIRCRTCDHHSSSKWYHDEIKLNTLYNKPMIMKSGKTDTDMWEQVQPHLEHVEKIYFAGGEPLIMDEHYRILKDLETKQRFDVHLVYNTNFTQVKFRDQHVFDYWKRFKNVSVSASLDAMESRAEYIRKDSVWSTIEDNRQKMITECPDTKFKIQATASILNVWHIPDFHRNWVEKGLVSANDLELVWVQDPDYYRIDIATDTYKQLIKEKIDLHCQWLTSYPGTESVILRYKSLVSFMFNEDRSHLLSKFWQTTHKLDSIRNENVLTVLPELEFLK